MLTLNIPKIKVFEGALLADKYKVGKVIGMGRSSFVHILMDLDDGQD